MAVTTENDEPTARQGPWPESPAERALVSRGWADIDRVERLGEVGTRRADASSLARARERSRAWYVPPESGHLAERTAQMYQSEGSLVRYRRIADFLSEGERVFEVGTGMGFLATMMLRQGLSRYRGVDLVEGNVKRTAQMLEVNGFADIADTSVKNLYELTREDVAAVDASLLVCCEVVEHVPDPELAVQTLADALPEGTDLLFSVPLLGRLEGVWGHGQVFGAARIHRMLEQAGLVAHHVEPLHNIWALVLASRSTAPSPRAQAALATETVVDPDLFVEPRYTAMTNQQVADLPRAESIHTKRVANVQETTVGGGTGGPTGVRGLRLTADAARIRSGPGKRWASLAGLAFRAPEGAKGVRLEVGLARPEHVESLLVEFRRDGQRIGLWQWKPAERPTKFTVPTFIIAPGRKGTFLRRVPGSDSVGADTVEVYVRGRADDPIDFSLRRWSWVS